MRENMGLLTLWVWVTPLNIIFLRSILFLEIFIISIFFTFDLNSISLCICTIYSLSTRVKGHLSYFMPIPGNLASFLRLVK